MPHRFPTTRVAALASALAFALLGLLALTPAARAEAYALPLELPLDAGILALDVFDGRVSVLVDPEGAPTLRVSDRLEGEDSSGLVLLALDEEGRLTLRQPHGSSEVAPPLNISVTLRPDQRLEVSGRGLDVTLESYPGDEARILEAMGVEILKSAAGRRGGEAARFVFNLDDSDLRVAGVADIEITGAGTRADLEATGGALYARLERGDLEVREHEGSLDVLGDADLVASGVYGPLLARLEGGSAMIRGGAGGARVTAREASVAITRREGAIDVRGNDSRIELREIADVEGRIELGGERQTVILERVAAPVRANLVGGSLEGRELAALALDLRELARARLEGVAGDASFQLSEDTIVEGRGFGGGVSGQGTRTRVELQGVAGGLDARFYSSELVFENVSGGLRLVCDACDLELDLEREGDARGMTRRRLVLNGTSEARVSLPSPCRLRIDDEGTVLDAIDQGGCTLEGRAIERGRAAPRPRARGGLRPLEVEVEIDGSSRLIIGP